MEKPAKPLHVFLNCGTKLDSLITENIFVILSDFPLSILYFAEFSQLLSYLHFIA